MTAVKMSYRSPSRVTWLTPGEGLNGMSSKNCPVYSGQFFEDIPFNPSPGVSHVTREGERYDIFTAVIERGAGPLGYVQIGEVQRFQFGDLPLRALLYLFVSAGISALTFFAGLLFARSSLKP